MNGMLSRWQAGDLQFHNKIGVYRHYTMTAAPGQRKLEKWRNDIRWNQNRDNTLFDEMNTENAL